MNGQWIRRIFDEQGARALYDRTINFWPEAASKYPEEYRVKVLSIIYDRLKTLSDLKTMATYFFEEPKIDIDMILQNKFLNKFSKSELENLLKITISKLTDLKTWSADSLQDCLNNLLVETEKKPAELFSLIRIAISFAPFSPALNLTLEVLGRENSLARLNSVARAF